MTQDWTHLFKKYNGRWVALADDETTVIAAAETARAVREHSKKKGTPDPLQSVHQWPELKRLR